MQAPVNTPIFICGCSHSGTTLMANIFAAHPDVYIPLRETNIFRGRDAEAAKDAWKALRREARPHEKQVLAEKTPKHVRRLDFIRSIAPRARFLVVVRDGRDVAASFHRRNGNARAGVVEWIKSNSVVARQRDRSDVMVYRHEDLIEEPETTMRAVFDFAGLSFTPDLLNFHEKPRLWFGQNAVSRPSDPSDRTNAQYRNWQVNQPIFDSRGRWKSVLTTDDFPELLEGRGQKLMRFFSYLD